MVELEARLVLGTAVVVDGAWSFLHYTQAHEGADGNLLVDGEAQIPYDYDG
jgi:hypothetical protein